MNVFLPAANGRLVVTEVQPAFGIGGRRKVPVQRRRTHAVAVSLVFSAHFVVLAALCPEPAPSTIETVPEPLVVSLLSAPRATLEPMKAPSKPVEKSWAKGKTKAIKKKTTRNRTQKAPAIHNTPAREPIATPLKNFERPVNPPAEKSEHLVSEAGSGADSTAPRSAVRHSTPTESGDRAASFNAAYLQNPAPEYPAISRRLREQGVVMLSVNVTAEGAAASVAVRTSSGSSRLDQAALKCVEKWRFVPARRAGQAVASSVIVPVRFSIEGDQDHAS